MLKKILTVAVATSLLLAGTLPAFAEEPEEGPTPIYDADEHILMFAVEGECMLEAEVNITFEVNEVGSITFKVASEDEGAPADTIVAADEIIVDESLDGCHPFSVEGPNGQVNHGTFVSNLMHALKEMGIKGSDKKEFKQALKGFGKGDQQVKANDDDGELDEGETSEVKELKVKPAKADKSNKEKSNRGHNN